MYSFYVSEGVDLRILELGHARELYNQCVLNRQYLAQWLPWANHINKLEDSRLFIQSELDRFANNRGFNCGIFYYDKLVGSVSVHEIDWNNKKTSIGYWLADVYQGKGIMTAACRRLIHHLFIDLKLNRIEIRACTENIRSRAIPERLRFKHEGTIRQAEFMHRHYYDYEVYGMLAHEWEMLSPNMPFIR
jgi:ribosomal-protein-serine acetyltransferase